MQGVLGLIILRAGWVAAGSLSSGTNWNKTLPCFQRKKRETERDKDRIMSPTAGNWRSVLGEESMDLCVRLSLACVDVCLYIQ